MPRGARSFRVPHYMEGTKASKMRESCIRGRLASTARVEQWEGHVNGGRQGSPAVKNCGLATSVCKNEGLLRSECCIGENLDRLPLADEYMKEVEFILKSRNRYAMYRHLDRLPLCHGNYKHLRVSSSDRDTTNDPHPPDPNSPTSNELQLPLITNPSSDSLIRESQFNRSIADDTKLQLETKPKLDRGSRFSPSSTHTQLFLLPNENHSISLRSNTSSLQSVSGRNYQSTRQGQSSSSLGNLMEMYSSSSFKFPAILKNSADSKLPVLTRIPDVLCSLPGATSCTSRRGVASRFRCLSSSQIAESCSFGPCHAKNYDQKENLKTVHGFLPVTWLSNDSVTHSRRFVDECGEENQQTTPDEDALNRDDQKRYFYEHTFSSLQKITSKGGPSIVRAKTFPSKRPSNSDRKIPLARDIHNFHIQNRATSKPINIKQFQKRTSQLPYNNNITSNYNSNIIINNNHTDINNNNSSNINLRNSSSRQTDHGEEVWRRERISAWVSLVNELAQHPPCMEAIDDHVPQTAFLFIHDDDDDDSFKLFF